MEQQVVSLGGRDKQLTVRNKIINLIYIKATIESIYDADTFRASVKGLGRLRTLGDKAQMRLYGVDTPEKTRRANCETERLAGLDALGIVKQQIPVGSKVDCWILEDHKDKYGRFLVKVNTVHGVDLASFLISAGVAKPYYGGTKQSWC